MSEKEYCNYQGVADFKSEIPTAENSEVNFKALSCNLSNSSLATLSEPTMNVDALINLSRFLENSQSSANFPDISVLPDVLRDVGKFVNERKQMKYNHERFKKTLGFLEDTLDKQYSIAYTRLMNETEIQLANVKSNERIAIEQIKRYYDVQMKKILEGYALKKIEMRAYYQNVESQRREQARRFDEMLKYTTIDRRIAQKAIQESEEVCEHLKRKVFDKTASQDDWKHYIELLRLRIGNFKNMTSIVMQLASKVE